MAFPLIASSAASETTTNQTLHTVAMPAGIQADDLLLGIFCSDGNPGHTWPAGWNKFAQFEYGTVTQISVAWRKATGSETSITVTIGSTQQTQSIVYRITAALDPTTQPPEAATASASVTPANPPNLVPTGGSKDYLWIAAVATDSNTALTGYPAAYPDNRYTRGGNSVGGPVRIAVATRDLTAASDDPGNFTYAASEQWAAVTVAVHPSASGSPIVLTPTSVPELVLAIDGPAELIIAPDPIDLVFDVVKPGIILGVTPADLVFDVEGGLAPPQPLAIGAYTISGAATTTFRGNEALFEPGAYALTGVAPTTLVARVASQLDPGSYAVTGAAADLKHLQGMNAEPRILRIFGRKINSDLEGVQTRVPPCGPQAGALHGS